MHSNNLLAHNCSKISSKLDLKYYRKLRNKFLFENNNLIKNDNSRLINKNNLDNLINLNLINNIINQDWFKLTKNEIGQLLEVNKWIYNIMKKVEVNTRAMTILQYRQTQEQLDKIWSFQNPKELWKKLIDLNKSTIKSNRLEKINYTALMAKERGHNSQLKSKSNTTINKF